jgi:hypothetical protein
MLHQSQASNSSESFNDEAGAGCASKSIPISNSHFHRTTSEIQLCLDEQIAEQRDHMFFARVVNGIQECQLAGNNRQLQMQNQMCLIHILQARKDSSQNQCLMPMPGITEPEQEYWTVGLSIDAPSLPHPHSIMMERRDVRSIRADALAIVNTIDDMIFDLEL